MFNTKVTIHNSFATVAEFVTNVYRTTIPLFNPNTELEAPEPTHIEVKYLNESIIVPVIEYDNVFTFSTGIGSLNNIEIIFLKETVSGYLKLSVASLTVR